MKYLMSFIFSTIIITFFSCTLHAQLPGLEETKTFSLLYLNLEDTKARTFGETFKIGVLIDGYPYDNVLCNKIKKGSVCNINSSYEFIDFIVLKIWDDNLFKDELLNEIKIERNVINEYDVIKIEKNNIVAKLNYRVAIGHTFKDLINILRQDISILKKKITLLRDENSSLQREIDNKKSYIDDLLNKNETLQNELEKYKPK